MNSDSIRGFGPVGTNGRKVDVLGLLDAQMKTAHALSADAFYAEQLPKLIAARDAVADLITAADAVCGNTPAAGQPGHIDFGDALALLQKATARIGSDI